MMEEATLNVLLAAFSALNALALFLVGWVINSMRSSIDELKAEKRNLDLRVSKLEAQRAESLGFRSKLEVMFEAISERLSKIEIKLDRYDENIATFWKDNGGKLK